MNEPRELQWDDIRYFLAACAQGSMSAGARSLGVEQSTMSRRVRRLEQALGVRLFERHADGLRPTARAEQLKAHASAAAQHIKAMEVAARHDSGGVVRVALTETMAELLVVPAMGAFLVDNPHIRLELNTALRLVDLLADEADIAIRNVRPQDDALVSRKVATLSFAAFAHRDYWASMQSREAADLDWIVVAEPAGVSLPEQQWYDTHVRVTPRITTTSFKAQLEAVRRGLGVGLVTHAAAAPFSELVADDLQLPEGLGFELWLVVQQERRELPKVRTVIDWLVDLCRGL